MRMNTLALASFVICVATVTAGAAPQDYVHVGYQPYIKGNPNTGTNPGWGSYSYNDVLNDMGLISAHFTKIRTWTIQYSNQYIIQAAHAKGVKVAMGAWGFPNSTAPNYYDEAASKAEIDSIVAQAKQYPGTVTTIICGNENLQDSANPNGLTQARIEELMTYAQSRLNADGLSGIKVATCQIDGVWIGHGSLAQCAALDEVWCDIYPFWHGDDPGSPAVSYFQNLYNQVKGVAGGKPVVIGETGWATAGNSTWWGGTCKPSEANAKTYFDSISAWLTANKVEGHIFEMFDEPWKYSANMNQESHFGIFEGWNHNRPKYAIPNIKSATSLEMLPDAMIAGQGFAYDVVFEGKITQTFDFYLVAGTPSGMFTLKPNGSVANGMTALYRRVPNARGPITLSATLRGAVPASLAGQDVTFYAAAMPAGVPPSAARALLLDDQTVTVQQ
ncbi:MAG: glycosyl hydrolase family 17 protein [Candidatus Aureabacteria bacterium]|nr:glycosyl hydrolase family 17 protein [Candidatus Auribacterota bacterium]